MKLRNAMCIEDLRRIARRNVPGVFFEYMEAGSYSEHTRDANVDDMRAIKLRQRVLVDVSQRKLSTTVLGEQLSMPLALAPTGLRRHRAGRMDAAAVRPDRELEGRRRDPFDLARQTRTERHPRCRGCARGAEARRRRHRGVEPWRAPARRRAVNDRGAAQG